MLKLLQQDIFEVQAQALVNPVNCAGAMGKGLAKEFKTRFPRNFEEYQKVCKEGNLRPGRIFTYTENSRTIFNFPTKDHWRNPSEYEFIELGLNALVVEILRTGVTEVLSPALGCGLGGLDFGKVLPMMNKAFSVISHVNISVCIPAAAAFLTTAKLTQL